MEEDKQQVEYFEWSEQDEASASAILSADQTLVKPFFRDKFERESPKMWNTFYLENGDRFFKDRHYLFNEFPMLLTPHITVLEIGCGVGNSIYPLFERNPSISIQAVDFAPTAIDILRQNAAYNPDKITAGVCDITTEIPFEGIGQSCDFVLVIFVLSAISPQFQRQAVENATSRLKPGGCVLLRDYAKYDLAELRLATHRHNKLGEDYYLKQDGTRVKYFTKEELREVFAGFEEVQNEYHYRVVRNRKESTHMKRIWLQAIFRKP